MLLLLLRWFIVSLSHIQEIMLVLDLRILRSANIFFFLAASALAADFGFQ